MECLTEVLIKGVEKDIFDGQRVEVLAVETDVIDLFLSFRFFHAGWRHKPPCGER